MVAAIDIGNTYTHIGFYRNDRLVRIINRRTVTLTDTILQSIFDGKDLEGTAIASVVPNQTRRLDTYFRKKHCLIPLLISSTLKLPIKIGYDKPKDLGADRLAASAGAFIRYRTNVLVMDFGTATTIDVVLKNAVHAGGVIAPGIGTSAWSLARKTALLPDQPLLKRPGVIGTSTGECIRSGILNGTAYMMQGFIRGINKKFRKHFLCVATGGWGKFAGKMIPDIDRFDPDLCLFGIINIYHANT